MMGSSVLNVVPNAWEPPGVKPLDEAVWRAWLLKNKELDRRNGAAYAKASQWITIGALLAAALLWSQVGAFAVGVRFIVTAGAMVVMARAFIARQYAWAAVFSTFVVLYNPVAPGFGFSGTLQHALVAGTAVVFAAALVWRKERMARNV